MKVMGSYRKQQGVVIVMALFVVALVATMAYVMLSRLSRDTERTSLLVRNVQGDWLASASVDWARAALLANDKNKKPNQLVDHFPMRSPVNVVQGDEVQSVIEDAQARFNLNNLIDGAAKQMQFQRLLQLTNPTLSASQASALVRAATDWVKPGQAENEFSAYYQKLPVPYRAAHRAMVSASELLLIKGMTPLIYRAIQPYVIALPVQTKINFSTLRAPVLASLAEGMTLEQSTQILKLRDEVKPTSIQAFLNLGVLKSGQVSEADLTEVSQYFLVETTVAADNLRMVLYTMVVRQKGMPILWQSKGVMG